MSHPRRILSWSLSALAAVVLVACGGSVPPGGASTPAEASAASPFGLHSMARFHLSGASSGPLDGLSLGMRLEDAWERAPALRSAFRVEMEASAYEALLRRVPDLGENGGGGNRFWTTRGRSATRTVVDGVGYELRFDYMARLWAVHLRLPNVSARDAAVAGWGPPDIDARYRVWLDEATGTQAAAVDCYKDDVPAGCVIELSPFQSVEKTLAQVFPDEATLVGRAEESLPFGDGIHWDFVRYYLTPNPADLWTPLEVQFDKAAPRRVVAYRTIFAYVYAVSRRDAILAELQAVVPDLARIEAPTMAGTCWAGSRKGVRVEVCENDASFLVTVGPWTY
ncbi:hypothetical protein [Polyangium mundeleinium]|uniref:Lipoprotein n=1 Tax=Polyangium mundeleinium TaxID=2995306 RepID=A0ABT5EW21_9BACT|nr:hypothetical protein [Polyangium mundeleinium]MDC0746001.1 hypothetical protein [Polyangium mundeleinium]